MIKTDRDGRKYLPHSPGADLDYSFDWTGWLEEDELIETSSWEVTEGITLTRQQLTAGTVTSVFAAGGIDGGNYTLVNTIVTDQGRTDSRVVVLRCQNRSL